MSKDRQILKFNGYEGSFTIESSGVIYEIILQNGNKSSPSSSEDHPKEIAVCYRPGEDQTGDFYREISQEMYLEVGKLAKNLNSSLRDFTIDDLKRADLPVTEEKIENAREDLESVVKMTETATLNIMDLIDAIQEDCQTVQNNVKTIQKLSALKPSSNQVLMEQFQSQVGSIAELRTELASMLDEKKAALDKLGQASADAQESTESEAAEQEGGFSIDGLLQALYEFCTSEDYKSKIKLMRQKQDELFQVESLQERLTQGTAELEEEDGLYPFPVTYLLEQLEQTCTNSKVKKFITAFLDNADSLFLDATLPLEMLSSQERVSQNGISADDPQSPSPEADRLKGEVKRLEAMLARLEHVQALEATASQLGEFSFIKTDDEATLMDVVERSSQATAKISTALTGIVEALSFQDLSGQRILKIIDLLRGVQIQLLTIIVGHDARVRERSKQPEISDREEERLVQSEIDRTLAELTVSEETEDQDGERFDQDKVDELLAELGF